MGLLSMCFGNGPSTTQIQPAPIGSQTGGGMTREAETLVGMLTQAQQMELQSAFRRFDVNGNGTMCAPRQQSPMLRPISAATICLEAPCGVISALVGP